MIPFHKNLHESAHDIVPSHNSHSSGNRKTLTRGRTGGLNGKFGRAKTNPNNFAGQPATAGAVCTGAESS